MIFLVSEGCFWPLTASLASEVKKNHAHVYHYRNLRKFSEINRMYGLTVNRSISLSGHSWIIDKIMNQINEEFLTGRIVFYIAQPLD